MNNKNDRVIGPIKENYAKLREKYGMTRQKLRVLKRLENYDLSKITEKFAYKPGMFNNEQVYPVIEKFGKIDKNYASGLETEFKRYIAMDIIEKDKSPSMQVDMYWHLLMLSTMEYRRFCSRIFGRFRDHVPSGNKMKLSERKLKEIYDIYKRTQEMYKDIYGKPDPRFW